LSHGNVWDIESEAPVKNLPKTIALVGCGKEKRRTECAAKDLYTGSLFRTAREWAETFADAWWIASAKHLILHPNDVIEPYDSALSDLKADDRRWRTCQIQSHFRARWIDCCRFGKNDRGFQVAVEKPRVVLLASREYLFGFLEQRERALCSMDFEMPLDGLGIGQRIAYLKREVVAVRHAAQTSLQLKLPFPNE
jgi:hypothetical protein